MSDSYYCEDAKTINRLLICMGGNEGDYFIVSNAEQAGATVSFMPSQFLRRGT